MNNYQFKIVLSGDGENPEEAWSDAIEGFFAGDNYYDINDHCELVEEDIHNDELKKGATQC